jgi:hypothetical protein
LRTLDQVCPTLGEASNRLAQDNSATDQFTVAVDRGVIGSFEPFGQKPETTVDRRGGARSARSRGIENSTSIHFTEITMNTRKALRITAFASTMLGAALAQAANQSPLDPSYDWANKSGAEVAGNWTAYVEPSPLRPSYYQGKAESQTLVGTAETSAQPERNPLHPRFPHS